MSGFWPDPSFPYSMCANSEGSGETIRAGSPEMRGSPEPSLVAYVIRIIISWSGWNRFYLIRIFLFHCTAFSGLERMHGWSPSSLEITHKHKLSTLNDSFNNYWEFILFSKEKNKLCLALFLLYNTRKVISRQISFLSLDSSSLTRFWLEAFNHNYCLSNIVIRMLDFLSRDQI